MENLRTGAMNITSVRARDDYHAPEPRFYLQLFDGLLTKIPRVSPIDALPNSRYVS
jgi:hypothetical protein